MKIFTFETFNKVMAAFVVAGVVAMAAIGVAAWAGVPVMDYQNEINTCSISREYEAQHVGQFDGAFFSLRGVVDNICYGKGGEDSAYYLIYDDIDAGMTYEAIRVSQETYAIVVDCLERGHEICGTLAGTKDYETIVYELHFED